MSQGREVVVGIVILLSVVVVAAGTLFLKGYRWGEEVTQVDALLRNVGQLMEGNDVVFRGVTIGSVQAITVEPGGEAVRVTMELDGQIELAEDAVVVLAPESLFGDWQAEIVSRSRFPRFDYYEVEEGRTTETGTPVLGGYALPDISRLTAAADEISENLAVLTDRVDRAFNEETAENLRLAISDIQSITSNVNTFVQEQSVTFEEVSDDVARAADDISAAATAARSTLERTDQLLASGEIDSILVNLQATSRNMEVIAQDVGRATQGLEGTLARADTTFANVQSVTDRIERGEGSLGMLLGDSALYLRAESTLDQLDALLADVRENPRRYINLSIF